jgi:diacylglycerol kinase (ATP)
LRLTLFHNPSAGHGRHSREELEQLARAFGHTVDAHSLGQPDWADALDDLGDLVVVAGGDGTVGAVATKMIGRAVPIAVIPMGTANNVASALGVRGTPEELMAAWPTSEAVGFDIGQAQADLRSLPFLECVGVGEFGRLMAHSASLERSSKEDDRERKLERDLAHLRDRVATSNVQGIELTIDGVDRSGEYLLAEVVNVWTIGPRLGLAPSAAVDDGRLHVVLVGPDHRAELVRYLERLRAGEAGSPELEVIAADRIELACDVHDLHVDGELWSGESPLVELRERVSLGISVLRSAVRFLRPKRTLTGQ